MEQPEGADHSMRISGWLESSGLIQGGHPGISPWISFSSPPPPPELTQCVVNDVSTDIKDSSVILMILLIDTGGNWSNAGAHW